MPKLYNQHDTAYKNLFSDPEMVVSLLRRFVPHDIVKEMDFSSLQPFPTNHITEDGREKRNDIVWKIKIKGSFCYLLFLLEFQSHEDWWMAVRILAYTALLWQDVIKAEKLKPGTYLPPVFPMVLYNGSKRWTVPVSSGDLLSCNNTALEKYQPMQEYFLLDIGAISDKKLFESTDFASLLFRFEQSKSIDNIIQILHALCIVLPASERLHLHRSFISWLGGTILRKTQISESILHCNTVQEAHAMLADIVPNWEKSFFDKGVSEGKIDGIKVALKESLEEKFGSVLPNEILSRIDSINESKKLLNLNKAVIKVNSVNDFIKILKCV